MSIKNKTQPMVNSDYALPLLRAVREYCKEVIADDPQYLFMLRKHIAMAIDSQLETIESYLHTVDADAEQKGEV